MPECEHDNEFDDLFDTDLFEIQKFPTQLNDWEDLWHIFLTYDS